MYLGVWDLKRVDTLLTPRVGRTMTEAQTKTSEDDEDLEVDVPLEALEPWNPFDSCVWEELETPITREEVAQAIAEGKLEARAFSSITSRDKVRNTREFHAQRIAYLVVNLWTDSIEIDVGVPVLGYYREWLPVDGNHRIAAAFYLNSPTIKATISGQIEYAQELGFLPKTPAAIYEAAWGVVRS